MTFSHKRLVLLFSRRFSHSGLLTPSLSFDIYALSAPSSDITMAVEFQAEPLPVFAC
jgi:hypothetical protein